jgi:1-acyl-sn-glycerol-3-phosphate acyltransferase
MITFLLTVYEWTLAAAVCIVLYPVALIMFIITLPFDRKKVILHRFSCFWATIPIWFQPLWKLSWEGRENIKKGQTYILVSNHQSLIDILVVYSLFKHFKWVAKNSLLKIPLLGWNMALNGYIIVKRSDTKSQMEMMKQAESTLNSGNSIMIFPEGTRSVDGVVGRFKRGAFILSEKTKFPVIPIALFNIDKTIKKNSFWVNKATNMRAKVLEPVYESDFNNSKEMAAAVQNIIAQQLEEWKQ